MAEKEAKTMGGCNNEFVVEIYDYEIDKDKVYVKIMWLKDDL